MLSKSRFLKTAILAALVGLAGAAAVTPASAHEFDRRGGFERDRGFDHGDHHGHRGWGHRHFHHRGWY
ncbi:MAG TPA: hypothetical protein VNU97_06315 [Rhizomicrobium sp.]|nr:hypothetical protein [Rhizomicrobium sp.]